MSFNVSVDGTSTQDINFVYTSTDVVSTNGTFDNLTATNGTITNLSFNTFSPSNINTSNLVANSITTNGLIASSGNITDLTTSTAIINDATISNGTATLSSSSISSATIGTSNTTESNHTGRIRLNYNGGDNFLFNDIASGNLHIQSSDDNIILEPNHNDSNNGKVEIDGDLELQHEFYLGTSSQAKIYQDINKLYIEADTSNPSGKDIFLRPQSSTDIEAVKILSGYGYGLLETDKVRVDDLEFSYLGSNVDLETILQDLTTNSITFSNGNGTALISQDNIGRLSLTSSTDDIYIQPKSFGRVQINGDLKIAGGYDEIQLNTAKINDFSSLFLLSSQNKEIRLRPKQGFSSEDIVISAGLGFSQLQGDKLIASSVLQVGGISNLESEIISINSSLNGKQNTLIAGNNITIVGNTISSTANVNLTATAPVNLSNNVLSVLLDTSPTLGSTNLINSGNIKNSIDLKQDTLTTSSNIHIDNLDLNGHLTATADITGDEIFVTGAQNTNANALTRKDYVDSQLLTKQNELIAQGGVKIDSATNIITSDNESIIVDNFADVYQNIATINAYITRLGYTKNFNTAGSGILNNGYTYPQISNNSVVGFMQKTLPNYAGNVEVRFGNNGSSGICKVLLDGVQKATASTGQTSLINFTFTANQVLKITQETNAILIPYHVKIKNHISLEATYPVKISGTTVSLFEDVVPTQGSLNFLNSGDIFTALSTKQNTINSSTSLVGFDITALNQLVGADVFVTNSQSTVPNSLTRKDYVDTQVATKQNTLTTSTNLNVNTIDCNVLEASNLKLYDIGNNTLGILAHKNMASATGYTLGITQNGDTTLNVNSSGNLKFTKNGSTNIATMNSSGIVIESTKDLFIGSTSLTSLLGGKQETLNNTIDVNCANLFSADEVTGAEMFVSNSQPNIANSLTRKDYVDTQVATKQDTLTAGSNISISNNVISSTGGGTTYTATDGVKIDGTVISADNRTIVIDDLANVYSSVSVVTAYLNGLGYTVTDINNVIPPYIQRGAFFYPRLYGASALNGRIEKTLPNFNGQLTINYGNGNVNNGFVKIYLDNVLQDTATQTEQDKTLVVDFTPGQALKIEETTSGAIIIYQIITRQRLALPVARTRLSQMSYYSRDAGSNLGTGIINFYSNTYNYILNDLGIVFTNQSDSNGNTGWLLPIGSYKIHYKYSFDNLNFNNRLGVRCRASMNGSDYQQSVGYSYARDDNFIDKQSVQADFLYIATTATYMRLRLNCAKNNTTYASNWDNTKILAGSSVIIEKID